MLVSIKWLEELLGIKIELHQLKQAAMALGIEVEKEFSHAPEGMVIARIKEIAAHPRIENLNVLRVKAEDDIQIVTAATNLKENDYVLVVPAGKRLKNEIILERDFAGISSAGILVSEEGLGLTEKSDRVIVLEHGIEAKEFKDYFDDLVVELKIAPNRPDLLGMLGLAREFSILLKPKCRFTFNVPRQFNRSNKKYLQIKDPKACPRYTARIFTDVKIADSPFWMKWRLHCMGMKGVNNVVDITNINMLLYGHPLHPFDLDLLKGPVIIRRANRDEEFITLEGTSLRLSTEDLIIADKDGPIALAGIIGARRAQISPATKQVFLESAYFDPRLISRTRRRLGIQTEASVRFERGADLALVDEVSRITGKQFADYARAQELEFIGVGGRAKPKFITFPTDRLNKILSLNLTYAQIKKILKKVNILSSGSKNMKAIIPHYRRDLNIAEDIYEEVARVFGYAKIPETPPDRWAITKSNDTRPQLEQSIKYYLAGKGFNETCNLSLVASTRLAELGYEDFVKIRNPLNERFDALRPTLFTGLLDCVNYNRAKGNYSLKLFEIGNILSRREPFQERRLGVIMGGELFPNFWQFKNERLTYYDAKGTIESLFEFYHISEIGFKPATKPGFSQVVTVISAGHELGYLGCIAKDLCGDEYFYFELSLDKIYPLINEPFYLPVSKFPPNTRDLSFLVGEDTEVPEVIETIKKISGPVLTKVLLFDYYRGKELPANKKSFGFRLHFRAPDRTLKDQEVDIFIEKIVNAVTTRFAAILRTKETKWTS